MKNFTSKALCLVFTLALGINLMHSNYKESDSGFLTTHVEKVSPGISDLDEVPIQCSGETVIPEYEVDGEWLSGNNDLVVAEGTSLKLSGLPNKLRFSIELPSGEIVGDDYDLGSVTPSQNGTYIVRSHEGCETRIALTVEGSSPGDTGNGSNCDGASVIPEYRINGEWLSGNNQVTVEEGTAVELSGLPNSLALSIQLPNGQIVSDDYNLGNVTPEANGTYIVRSSGGCETTITLTVEGGNTENPNPDTTCNGRTVIPEYEIDGEWQSGNNELVLEEGTALKLSGLPNSLSLTIILPNGDEVSDDYDLGTITSSDEGTYIVRSSEGCETPINLTVTGGGTACEGENVIPEYRIDGEWLSGENRISVPEGTPVVLSGLPNSLRLMVELPNGEIQSDDFSLGNITTAQAGTYTIRSSEGCSTTLTIDVTEEPTADCVGETIIPEYQVNGEWLDGDKQLSVSEGTMLVLSGLPNSLRLSIELPDGNIVGDDYDLGSVTPSDSGTYIIRSEEGCEVSFALTVTDDGNSGPEGPGGDGPAVGAQRVEAETEAEAEVESETDDGVAAGSVAVGAAGAALSPNSAAISRTSGSISKSTNIPAERLNPDESTSQGGNSDGAPEPGDNESGGDTTDEGSEAEAEAEAESEAEAEVANGAAVAAGGSAVSAAGGGRSVYLDDEGRLVLYPSEATLGADAKTSTSTSTSKVNITFPANNEPQGGGGGTGGGGGDGDSPISTIGEKTTINEDTAVNINVLSNDTGPIDPTTVAIESQPSNGIAVVNADGTVRYTPDANFNGEDSFVYSVGDGNGNKSNGVVDVAVTPINDLPTLTGTIPDQNGVVGQLFNYTFPSDLFSDPDVNDRQLSLSVTNLPSGLQREGSQIVGTPRNAGDFKVAVQATDQAGATVQTDFNLNIRARGASNVTTVADMVTADENTPTTVAVLDNDQGPVDTATVAIERQPSNGRAAANPDGTVTYTSDPNFFGSDSFVYSVRDTDGVKATGTVSVTVNNVNSSPVVDQGIADQTAQVGQNFSFTIPMNAFSDPDPDTQLSITAMNLPPGLAFEDTKIVGIPQQAGSFSVIITVEDEGGLTASTMFDINVSNASTARAARMASLNAKKSGTQTLSAPAAKGTSLTARGPGAGLPFADPDTVPLIQTDTEAEVESESEAEAEAETVTGAAAAVATGGSAVAAVGDFAEADALVSVASSTSTSEVNEEQPELFANMNEDSAGGATTTRAASPNINNTKAVNAVAFKASDILNIPQPTDGKGLFESESEAEAEAEAEAEVDNNAAAASAVASGGGGANGIGATARVASSTAVSTSTENNNGTLNRANDEVDEESNRFDELVSTKSEAEAEVETEAEATAGNGRPTAVASAGTVALGDVTAEAQLTLQDAGVTAPAGSSARQLPSDFPWVEESFYKKGDRIEAVGVEMARGIFNVADKSLRSVTSRAVPLGNLESENEAEAEAEAEAEVGFNAAAASASAVSVQAKNGLVPLPANAASATSTSTSVFDNGENKNNHESFPGAAEQGNYGDLPDLDVDLDSFILETETEAEAEAEVGFEAAAASVAASAAGYEGIQAKTAFATTPYASAAAAGSGARVTLSVITPAENEAGIVAASATATDPQGRGVAVAVAVAGVPFEDGSDNESEAEQEGLTIATVNVSVFTDPADAQNPRMLPMGDDGEGNTGGSATDADNEGESVGETEIESEAEAEAEAESEAAYGVAAASAAATASGIGAVASANTSTSTMAYDGSYELNTTTASVANFTARAESSDAVLNWKSVGVDKFAVDHMVNGTYEEIGTVESANQGKSEDYMFRMYGLEADQEHRFRLRPLKSSIGAQEASFVLESSDVFSISAPYPNVMTSRTQTEVAVKRDQKVTAKVYDMSGRVINTLYDDVMRADLKENLIWVPGQSIPNGLYFIKIEGKDFTETFKVILRK